MVRLHATCRIGHYAMAAALSCAGHAVHADNTDPMQIFRQGLQFLEDLQQDTSPPQQGTQGRPNPMSRGAAAARYNWCSQLTQSGLSTALAAAPLGASARALVFGNGGNGYVLEQCASQLHYHLCSTEIINLAGSFLTGGPGSNRYVDALPEVTNAAGTQSANPLGVFGAVVGGVGTTAATGSVSKGALGGLAGYGAGSTAGKVVSVASCDQRRQMLDNMSNAFRASAYGETANDVDRLFARNARYIPAAERSVFDYAAALSHEMRLKARVLASHL
ncbi:MAG: hypothetical protein KDJ27_14740 [Gammaproteobacteria bacterium]|nr:hypothetical protein [Gammaproteobacteria bacterium]